MQKNLIPHIRQTADISDLEAGLFNKFDRLLIELPQLERYFRIVMQKAVARATQKETMTGIS